MARILYTTSNLVDEVRALSDEANQDSLSTNLDILPSLNRAQDYAFDIYARRYPEPILAYSTLTLSSANQEYDIPEYVFEDRVLKIEVQTNNGTFREVTQISYMDLTDYESRNKAPVPYYYCIIGRKIRFIPGPSGIFNARIWYLRNPEKLVLPQGRVTITNVPSNYVIVDSIGEDLSTESDQLESYVNVVDGQTGEIKGSLQIQTLEDNRITFRTVPLRDTVLNREILTLADITLSPDDYVCAITGTCVPYYGRPTSNFLIQYAVADVAVKLGGDAQLALGVLDKFERQLEKTYSGRQSTMRVQRKSRLWATPSVKGITRGSI